VKKRTFIDFETRSNVGLGADYGKDPAIVVLCEYPAQGRVRRGGPRVVGWKVNANEIRKLINDR
jgi:hypothetical protein